MVGGQNWVNGRGSTKEVGGQIGENGRGSSKVVGGRGVIESDRGQNLWKMVGGHRKW